VTLEEHLLKLKYEEGEVVIHLKREIMVIGLKSILCLIGAFIVIIFVSQAQISLKDELSPLCEFREVQAAEGFGLAPTGSANSDLDFGSVATTNLKATNPHQNRELPETPPKERVCCPPGCGPGKPDCPPCVRC
jgi:hypothetical protein